MADLEGRYHKVPLDDHDSRRSGHWSKVGVTLLGGSCLIFLCIAATYLYGPTRHNNSTNDSTSLFHVPTSRSGLAAGQFPQEKIYKQGLRQFMPSLPYQPQQSRTSFQSKAEATAVAPRPAELSPFERISRIAGAASSLGYLKLRLPFKITGEIFEPESVIWSPAVNPAGVTWGFLDDITFGGNSKSSFDISTGMWSGKVDDTGAGFASLRTPVMEPPLDLTDCSGLRLKIKGQGQRLKFLVRDDNEFNGVSWAYGFTTNPWFDTEVKIKFSDFVPTKDARLQNENEPILNPASITVFQLIYSKTEYDGKPNPTFKNGAFQVELKEISTF